MTRPEYRPGRITEFSDDDTMKSIDKIVVDERTVTVAFKAGIEVTVGR